MSSYKDEAQATRTMLWSPTPLRWPLWMCVRLSLGHSWPWTVSSGSGTTCTVTQSCLCPHFLRGPANGLCNWRMVPCPDDHQAKQSCSLLLLLPKTPAVLAVSGSMQPLLFCSHPVLEELCRTPHPSIASVHFGLLFPDTIYSCCPIVCVLRRGSSCFPCVFQSELSKTALWATLTSFSTTHCLPVERTWFQSQITQPFPSP